MSIIEDEIIKNGIEFPLILTKEIFTNIVVKISYQMCELQKQECAYNAKLNIEYSDETEVCDDYQDLDTTITINKESILNTKNICE